MPRFASVNCIVARAPLSGSTAVQALGLTAMQPPAHPPQHPAPSTKAPAHACLIGADLSAVLRLARAGLKWSQADFAKVAKLSIRTVQMIEAGDLDPRASTLRKLASVLHHHGVDLWRDETGAIGVACAKVEQRVVPMRQDRSGCR